MSRFAIGGDLGGTNFRVALYEDLSTASQAVAPKPIASRREPVGVDRAPQAVVRRLASTIESLCTEAGVSAPAVGIGFAGMLEGRHGFVVNSPHFGWHDVPFGQLLTDLLGTAVTVDNDVNAITLAEARLGSATGSDDVLAVLAGTGIGGGLLLGGRLIRGGSGCAGEIGHFKVVLGDTARPCHCGQRGCVEAYVGGRNLRDRVHADLAAGKKSRATVLAGDAPVELSNIDQAASEGDAYALALYEEITPMLGVTLGNAITLINPDTLVLGGGVLSRTPVLKQMALLEMELAANAPALRKLKIVDAALGDDAGLVGSALMALESNEAP